MGWRELLLEVDECCFGVSDRAFVSRVIVVVTDREKQQKQEVSNNTTKNKNKKNKG